MGILNRTPDSFYDKGATYSLDAFYSRAEALVADGADILDVGGVKAGPGPEVTEAEEIDRVVSAVAGLVSRFPTPVSVDTWRASVARLSYREGALMGNDISGFADPDYLAAAAEFGPGGFKAGRRHAGGHAESEGERRAPAFGQHVVDPRDPQDISDFVGVGHGRNRAMDHRLAGKFRRGQQRALDMDMRID